MKYLKICFIIVFISIILGYDWAFADSCSQFVYLEVLSNGSNDASIIVDIEDSDNSSTFNPNSLPDLRLHEMKVYRGDTLLKSGKNQSQVGEEFEIENYIVSEEADCQNGNDTNTKNVESTLQVQIGNGSWKDVKTVRTRPSTLKKDKPHKETIKYKIPEEAKGKMIRFRIDIDTNDDIIERNENNNLSDPNNERYPIIGDYNLIVDNASLTNNLTEVYQNTIGRVRYAIVNIDKDTPLSSQGVRSRVEVKKPGSLNYVLINEDGSDSDELIPNRFQEESTSLDGFPFDIPGIWTFKITTDYNQRLIETNEGDNAFCFSISVIPDNRKADIVIAGCGLKEGSSFKKGKKVHPYVYVENKGNAYPEGKIEIDYLIDGRRRDGDTIEASELGPGTKRHEKVNNDKIKLGDKGNRTLKVTIKIKGKLIDSEEFKFKVK